MAHYVIVVEVVLQLNNTTEQTQGSCKKLTYYKKLHYQLTNYEMSSTYVKGLVDHTIMNKAEMRTA